jgi:hypothetical protein
MPHIASIKYRNADLLKLEPHRLAYLSLPFDDFKLTLGPMLTSQPATISMQL